MNFREIPKRIGCKRTVGETKKCLFRRLGISGPQICRTETQLKSRQVRTKMDRLTVTPKRRREIAFLGECVALVEVSDARGRVKEHQ